MTRKQTTVVTKEETLPEEPEAQEPEADAEEQKARDALQAIADSLGAGLARCTIFIVDDVGRPAYHGMCLPEAISEEYLQKKYGGGSFIVKFLNAKSEYIKSKHLQIAAPPVEEGEPIPYRPDEGAPMQALIESQLLQLREDGKRQHELVLAMIDKLGSNNQQQKGPSLTEIMTAIGTMSKMTTPPAPPSIASQMTEIVGLLKTGIELGASGGAPDKGWIDHIKDGVKHLPEIMGALKSGVTQPGQPAEAQENPHVTQLRWLIGHLKPKALANKDYTNYVYLAMDYLDDPKWAPLAQYIAAPYEEIAKIDPEILQPHLRPWFEALFTTLKGELQVNAQVPAEGDSSGATGDTVQPTGNGAVSEGSPDV